MIALEVTDILSAIPDGMAVVSSTGEILSVNNEWRKFARANGGDRATTVGVGLNYFEVCLRSTEGDLEVAKELCLGMQACLRGENDRFELEYACNSPTEQRWFIARVTKVSTNEPPLVLVSHVNITSRKIAELEVKRQSELLLEASLTDSLTGLRNRRGLQMSAAQLLSNVRRRGGAVAAVFIDLDKFKSINDTFGHEEGDRVLKFVAAYLRETFRESDVVARVGGDEFVVIAWLMDKEHVESLRSRIITSHQVRTATGQELHVSFTVGITVKESDQEISVAGIVSAADALMYQAKTRPSLQ